MNFSAEKFGGIEILRIFAVFKFYIRGRESSPDAPHSGFFYAPGGTPIQAVRSPRDAVVMAASVLV